MTWRVVTSVLIAGALSPAAALAAAPLPDLDKRQRIDRAAFRLGFLTRPSKTDPADVALSYARARDVPLRLTSRYRSPDGVTHLAWAQTADGIDVDDASLVAHVARDGRLVGIDDTLVRRIELRAMRPRVRARGRLTVMRDGRLAWRRTETGADGLPYEVVTDAADGDVVLRRSLARFANQATVYDNHPGPPEPSTPTTVDLGADPTWVDRKGSTAPYILQGNNAHAYAITGSGLDEIESGAGDDWQFPQTPFDPVDETCPVFQSTPWCTWDDASDATLLTNKDQWTTQAFYYVNRFHDHLEADPVGFNHASRNFEHADPDGAGGGVGGDPMNISVSLTGDLTDNAFMFTQEDGTLSEITVGPFSVGSPLHSADAADIVYHEYAHGLSHRLAGDGTTITSYEGNGMSEGWSDWYALDFLVEDGRRTDTLAPGELEVGEYVSGDSIRRQGIDCPMAVVDPACPAGGLTFADLGLGGLGRSTHGDGEIWAAILWDIRRALGADTTRALVTAGLRLGPNDDLTFTRGRDAIIQADQVAGGDNYDELWGIFAGRGLGFGARIANEITALEAFDVPGTLRHVSSAVGDPAPLGDGDGAAEPGETVTVDPTVRNPNPFALGAFEGLLSSSTSGIGVTQGRAGWPSGLAGGASDDGDANYAIAVPEGHECGAPVELAIDATPAAGPEATFSVPTGQPGAAVVPDSADVPKNVPDNSGTGVTSTLAVTGFPGRLRDMDVRVGGLTQTHVGDVSILLIAPDGKVISLFQQRGSTGDGFDGAVFDDEAATASADGDSLPPYTGAFRPEHELSQVDGVSPNGTWTLKVVDHGPSDVAVLEDWGLTLRGAACSVDLSDPPGDGGTPPPLLGPTPPAATPPAGPPAPGPSPVSPTASFASTPRAVRVGLRGAFALTFRATPLAAGGALLQTDRRPRRRLARKDFRALSNGRVTLRLKLSRRELVRLRRTRILRVRLTVTLGGRAFVTRLTLRAPRR